MEQNLFSIHKKRYGHAHNVFVYTDIIAIQYYNVDQA